MLAGWTTDGPSAAVMRTIPHTPARAGAIHRSRGATYFSLTGSRLTRVSIRLNAGS